ncbi:PREDICTED: apolipoprotein L6 [Elephantulus edwardii]|uniref:apolipoprotein L6 n=1 Tax=Elephantulus edwardii TaxID=28737 RepID=UPI0003F0BC21|nr:PREDICTED: apolipoprotein L6 [Elephantulus edwardii]
MAEDDMWDPRESEDLSPEERIFLKEFPSWKSKVEEYVHKLYALADYTDSRHSMFTKTNVVVNSITVASGLMSLLGLALPAVTVGGSLLLATAGKSLMTAAGATGLFTNVYEYFHNKKVQAQASSLALTLDQGDMEAGGKEAASAASIGQTVYHSTESIREIRKYIRAFRRARAHPHLVAAAKRYLRTGKASARRSRQLKKVFEGTPVIMARNARLLGIVTSGFFFGLDLASLLSDLKELKEGTGTETAKELRAKARELEKLLSELSQLNEGLQQKLEQEENVMNSTLEGAM